MLREAGEETISFSVNELSDTTFRKKFEI